MEKILATLFLATLLAFAIVLSCSKTIILNEVEIVAEEEFIKPTRADTTARDIPQMQEDTLHEITFQPMIEAWVISESDTLKV